MARLPRLTPRGRETQRVLRETLLHLTLEKGFDQVTIKDITDRAGVDRTTFYLHFTDKHDLLEQTQRQVIDELVAHSATAALSGDGFLPTFRHIAANALAYRVLLTLTDAAIERRLHDYAAQSVGPVLRARLVAQGAATDLSIDLLAQYVTSALRGTARWWLEQDMPYSPEEMASLFRRLLVGGLAAFVAEPGAVSE